MSSPKTPSKKKIKALVLASSMKFFLVNIICSILDKKILKTGYTAPRIPEASIPNTNNI